MIDQEVKKEVLVEIDKNKDSLISFLRDIVNVPSVTGTKEVGKAQKVVKKKFEEIEGLKIETWEPDIEELKKYPEYPIRTEEWSYEGRPNVIGILEGKGEGKSLILNGHIDVVSPEPISAWNHDPWSGEIDGNRMYGRGTFDMKAGIAAMTYALLAIRKKNIDLKGSVTLESVVEEEHGGGGTLATIVRGYKADAAIIAEPSGSSNILIGAGGSSHFNIRVTGKATWPHAAHFSVNAYDLVSRIYNALKRLEAERYRKFRGVQSLFETLEPGPLFTPRCTDITIGIIRCGDETDMVPGWGELKGIIEFCPPDKVENIVKEIEDTVKKTAEADPWMRKHPPTLDWSGSRREPHILSVEEPIVQTAKRYSEEITGKPAKFFATPAASDISYFTPKVGEYGGIPAIWYGPGGAGAHEADEYVDLNELLTMTKIYALLILDWCQPKNK